jgi:hypothetical protein
MNANTVHTPGAGLAWARQVLGDRVPEVTDDDRRHTDELLEQARTEARRLAAHPRQEHDR